MTKKIISSKVLRWASVGLFAGLIFLVSSMSMEEFEPTTFTLMDKCVHFIVFGLFCTILCWAISAHVKNNKIRKAMFIAVIITSLYGVSDEVHQLYVPTRTGELYDWLADTAGAATAGICWLKFLPVWKRRIQVES